MKDTTKQSNAAREAGQTAYEFMGSVPTVRRGSVLTFVPGNAGEFTQSTEEIEAQRNYYRRTAVYYPLQ